MTQHDWTSLLFSVLDELEANGNPEAERDAVLIYVQVHRKFTGGE